MKKFFILLFVTLGFFLHVDVFAQVDEPKTYTERMGEILLKDTSGTVDIYVYGVTFRTQRGIEKNLPGVTITMRDLFGETIQITSDDSAYYQLELNFDNMYSIYFEYEGMYTKFLEIDTRNVIDIEQERGYLFPTDVTMHPSDNYEVAALYLKKPVGKAYFDRRLQMIIWDLKYTDRLNAERDKILKKKSIRKQ